MIAGMKPIQDIRRQNLRLLLLEAEATIGKERGAAAHLSRLTDVPSSQISQFSRGKSHPDGSPRTLGDSQARKLERGTNKKQGWMDVDHGDAKNVDEAALLDLFRSCGDAQRLTVLDVLKQLAPRQEQEATQEQGDEP